jgi:hypothetical protein
MKKAVRKAIKSIIDHLQTYFAGPRSWDRETRGEGKSWWWFEIEIKMR